MHTIWILGDQLSPGHAAFAGHAPGTARVLMIESKARGSVLRYHQMKLVLIYSAMRHYAQELRKSGWEVDYYTLEQGLTFEEGVRGHVRAHQPATIALAEPNSFLETVAIEKLGRKLKIEIRFVSTTQFLLPRRDFHEWASGQRSIVMENHYRRMRKRFGWLMDANGQPEGGAWNYDIENRATLRAWQRAGSPRAQTPLRVSPDAITREVIEMVEREFAENPGRAADMWLPVDREGALKWLELFIRDRLPNFGVYEDMMAEHEPILFHSLLSPMLNLGLLEPRECVEAAIDAYRNGRAPLNSVEGFVRQILGWREFINGIYWYRGPGYRELNSLSAAQPLPKFFYTGDTDMNCLHHVLRQDLALGWNHHIQRLIVLGNFLLITGINPQQALRWYSEMYVDAYDWVMAPNVIGMSLYADGGSMATKPYAATSSYIDKMSNYCKGCRFDPKQKTGSDACPFNYLYWHFIDQHADRFSGNPRMRTIVSSWLKRSETNKEDVRVSARGFLSALT